MSKEETTADEQTATDEQGDSTEAQGDQADFVPDTQVTVGDYRPKLKAPDSYMVCREILLASSTSYERACCAALGACWLGPGRIKTRYKFDPLRYGGDVFDELAKRGVHPKEIAWAGMHALHHVAARAGATPTKAEVDEAGDFTPGADG